jgi:hypothetical protein
MKFQSALPGCCSVGMMYGFYDKRAELSHIGRIKDTYGDGWGNNTPASEHFIVILKDTQYWGFKKLCERHTCVSTTAIKGGHQGEKIYLAVCVFRVGKEKQK